MLDPKHLHETLARQGIRFFAGVPDSLLKDFCAYVTDNATASDHVITANEGSAIALAAGHHLATSEIPLVYMQNSGLGNTINPLTSLVDGEVYAIPMLLLIGWRGEPGKKDEPQHVKAGRVQIALLDALEIEHAVLPDEADAADAVIEKAVATMRAKSAPFALLVRAGTFAKYALKSGRTAPYEMTREEAIAIVAHAMGDVTFVSTTGMPSRELFEYRVKKGDPPGIDFLTVGSMGHASQIALGVALKKPNRIVCCLDGDGAVIMHMGGLSTIGTLAPKNYRHVVVNNGAHDSVGGQPTVAFDVDLAAIARANGYRATFRADDVAQLREALPKFRAAEGPVLLEVRVRTGARADLGRPTATPRASKEAFMKRLRSE